MHENENNEKIIEVQWGGYYVYKDKDDYRVFRLLDLDRAAYHSQYFHETFDHAPEFSEIKDLRPYIWHTPLAAAGLLTLEELTLIGFVKLDDKALAGYEDYLTAMGVSESDIRELRERVLELSELCSKKPVKFKISKQDKGISITRVK